MIEFNIDEIREEIKDLSYEDKLDFLEDKESNIEALIEELQGYVSDISSLEDEIKTERNNNICQSVLQSLKNAGYPLELDSNGNVSFSLGKVDITILMSFVESKVDFFFNAKEKQLKYRELINSLVPDFDQDGNFFSRQVAEEKLIESVVDLVSKLMNNRQIFEN
jgi:hypothetical protein